MVTKILPSMMQETVTVEPYLGASGYGPIYGAPLVFDPLAGNGCYVEPGFRRVTDRKGEEVVASALLIAPPAPVLHALDRVTWMGLTYAIIDAQPLRLQGESHHQEAMLQSVAPATAPAGGGS